LTDTDKQPKEESKDGVPDKSAPAIFMDDLEDDLILNSNQDIDLIE